MLDSTQDWPVVEQLPYDPCSTPENRLLLAVLYDALGTFQRGLHTSDCREIEAFREVDRWFRSRDYDWPFSFESICSTLQIDPGHIRDGLNRLRTDARMKRTVKRKRMIVRERFCNRGPWNGTLGQ